MVTVTCDVLAQRNARRWKVKGMTTNLLMFPRVLTAGYIVARFQSP